MRRARRVDANQRAIVEALRAAGRTVEVLSDVGRGVPDLLVGFHGRNYLLEVKVATGRLTRAKVATGRLTRAEAAFASGWRGHAAVVRTPQEAIRATGEPIHEKLFVAVPVRYDGWWRYDGW